MKKTLCLIVVCLLALLPGAALADGVFNEDGTPALTPAPGMAEDGDPFDPEADEETEAQGDDGATDVFGYDGYNSAITLTYESLTNNTFKLTLDRPAGWTQIPGRYTLCFVENAAEGQIPARMALTRKQSSKDLTDTRITNELISYLKILAAQYDEFEVGELNKETSFIEQMGYSTLYTARKDGMAVRGYVIMAAVNKYLYVFHFSSRTAPSRPIPT